MLMYVFLEVAEQDSGPWVLIQTSPDDELYGIVTGGEGGGTPTTCSTSPTQPAQPTCSNHAVV